MNHSSADIPPIDDIIDNFALLDEWDDRYRYVIELGRGMNPLPELERTEANKVQGCASQTQKAPAQLHIDVRDDARGAAFGLNASIAVKSAYLTPETAPPRL